VEKGVGPFLGDSELRLKLDLERARYERREELQRALEATGESGEVSFLQIQ
jgi:hypothetical protein